MWRNAPMRVLSSQGILVDSYDPALKEHRTVCFLAFDGHCYMYRAVKQVLEHARGARRGRPCRPSKSEGALTPRTCSRGCSGARTAGARRQLMAVGKSPKVAISSPAQYCGLGHKDSRAAGGAQGAAEVVRRSTRSLEASAWPAWRTRFSC